MTTRKFFTDNIIRINNLNLTLSYLDEDKKKQEQIACDIIKQALSKMKTNSTLIERAAIMGTILQRSINRLEEEELFEECKILLDVKNAIPKVLEELGAR